jgi:hypothetical protein
VVEGQGAWPASQAPPARPLAGQGSWAGCTRPGKAAARVATKARTRMKHPSRGDGAAAAAGSGRGLRQLLPGRKDIKAAVRVKPSCAKALVAWKGQSFPLTAARRAAASLLGPWSEHSVEYGKTAGAGADALSPSRSPTARSAGGPAPARACAGRPEGPEVSVFHRSSSLRWESDHVTARAVALRRAAATLLPAVPHGRVIRVDEARDTPLGGPCISRLGVAAAVTRSAPRATWLTGDDAALAQPGEGADRPEVLPSSSRMLIPGAFAADSKATAPSSNDRRQLAAGWVPVLWRARAGGAHLLPDTPSPRRPRQPSAPCHGEQT